MRKSEAAELAASGGSVKDIAKNMNFGFLGQSRTQMLIEKKKKEEEEMLKRKREQE